MCNAAPDVVQELLCDESAPGTARALLTRSLCPEHQVHADDGLLLVSELVTNAVVHAGPPLLVSVECTGRGTRIGVHDGSKQVSDVDPPELEDLRGWDAGVDEALPDIAEHGRGLVFMAMLTDEWHVTLDDDGKWIFFDLGLVDRPAAV